MWDKNVNQFLNFSSLWHKFVIGLIFFSDILRQNWNSTLKVFVTETQICYSSHNFFDVVRQTSKATFKTFGNMRHKWQSLFDFFNTMTQICISPHIFFGILRQNWNSTLKFFGTVRRNCFSPQNFSDAVWQFL